MNHETVTIIKPNLSILERLKFNVKTIEDLTDEQRVELENSRTAERLINEQERELGIQRKYTARPLAGNNNDERWIVLKEHFSDHGANTLNMLMGSTSGIHGSGCTLDDLTNAEEYLKENEIPRSHDEAFTILIIQPRICRITYGTVGIRSDDDIKWLRNTITESVKAFIESQEGNTWKE